MFKFFFSLENNFRCKKSFGNARDYCFAWHAFAMGSGTIIFHCSKKWFASEIFFQMMKKIWTHSKKNFFFCLSKKKNLFHMGLGFLFRVGVDVNLQCSDHELECLHSPHHQISLFCQLIQPNSEPVDAFPHELPFIWWDPPILRILMDKDPFKLSCGPGHGPGSFHPTLSYPPAPPRGPPVGISCKPCHISPNNSPNAIPSKKIRK